MACQGIGPAGTGRIMSQVPVRAVKLKSQGSKMATVEPQASTSWSDSLFPKRTVAFHVVTLGFCMFETKA